MPATLIRKTDIHNLPDPQAVVIFNAIPHCGSATVTHLLHDAIKKYVGYYPFVSTPPRLEGMRCIGGHGAQNVHMLLPKKEKAWYFTMLRHPLRSAISNFTFSDEFLHNERHSKLLQHQLLTWSGWLTRFLGDGDIERARDTLFHDYAFYGITEHFDESLQRLETLLPEIAGKTYVNIAVSQPRSLDIPNVVLEWFHEQNKDDIALYEEALRLFAPKKAVETRARAHAPTPHSARVTEMLSSVQDAPKAEAIVQEVGNTYQTARILKEHGHYAEALHALDKAPDSAFMTLRIEIYFHMQYHAHVLRLGEGYLRTMLAQDPHGYVPDIIYSMAHVLVFVYKSYRNSYPELPPPPEYGVWLRHCAGSNPVLFLLNWCCEQDDPRDLEWFLAHCSPHAQRSLPERGRALHMLAARCLRQGDHEQAISLTQQSLRCNTHSPHAWLTLTAAEHSLGMPCTHLPMLLRIVAFADALALLETTLNFLWRSISDPRTSAEEKNACWHAVHKYSPLNLSPTHAGYERIPSRTLAQKPVLVLYHASEVTPHIFDALLAMPGMEREHLVCCSWGENDTCVSPELQQRFDLHLDSHLPLLAAATLTRHGKPAQYDHMVCISPLPPHPQKHVTLLARLLTGRNPLFALLADNIFMQENMLLHLPHDSGTPARRVAVWGIGGRYRDVLRPQLRHAHCPCTQVCFIDSNAVPGQHCEGLPVLSPEDAARQPVDAVLVASVFREQITARAETAGVKNLFWF